MKNIYLKSKLGGGKINLILIYLLLFSAIIFAPAAEARVMITPTRIVFEEGQRSAVIRLVNPDDVEATYRVTFLNSIMTEEGLFENINTPEDRQERLENYLAEDLIRYSPRQVILPPGEVQLVRLQLIKPADLKTGEYRSRLLFQAIPAQEETAADLEEQSDSVSNILLQAIYGVSIPIIVRQGDTWSEVELSDLKLNRESENPELSLIINRNGNASVFGDLEVIYVLEREEETTFRKTLARVRGIAVYPEIERRNYTLTLSVGPEIDLEKGKLNVIYRSTAEAGGKILTETTLEL